MPSPAVLQAVLQEVLHVAAAYAKHQAAEKLYNLLSKSFPLGHKGRIKNLGVLTLHLCPKGCLEPVPATINLDGVRNLSDVFNRTIKWCLGDYSEERLGSRLCWQSVKNWRNQFVLFRTAVQAGAESTSAGQLLPLCADLVSLQASTEAEQAAILSTAAGLAGQWKLLTKEHLVKAVEQHKGTRWW
jgi:hypothetical protein